MKFRCQIRIQQPNFSLNTSFHVASSRNVDFMAMLSLKTYCIKDLTVKMTLGYKVFPNDFLRSNL